MMTSNSEKEAYVWIWLPGETTPEATAVSKSLLYDRDVTGEVYIPFRS
jgi:hypothetical protein